MAIKFVVAGRMPRGRGACEVEGGSRGKMTGKEGGRHPRDRDSKSNNKNRIKEARHQ